MTLLDDDGSAKPYQHPSGRGGDYFRVPHVVWLSEATQGLTLAARALLLIALASQPGFILPIEKAPKWYSISADTAQRGLSELHERGLLTHRLHHKRAPLAPGGMSYDRHFYLAGPLRDVAAKAKDPRHPKPAASST